MNSPTQTQSPTSITPETLIDDLRSELIVAGIPSTAFTITDITKNNTDYLFIEPTFNTDTRANAFTLARWVWIVTYDNRFTPVIPDEHTSGYAIKHDHVSALLSRFEPIETQCHGALNAYFGDHNLIPKHLNITFKHDYITTPNTDNTITINFTLPEDIPNETKTLVQDGWINATNNDLFTHTEPTTATISVADATTLLNTYFNNINTTSWDRQYDPSNWD